MRLRAATEADFPELTRIRAAGIASYASFAPEGWEPPDENEHVERVTARMLDPDHWVTLAEDDDGRILGYVAAGPAMTEWSEGHFVPGTAYLWMLFIELEHHGTGVGRALQDSAFDEMRRRGYERALVRMAAGAAQARGFYAATGWRELEETEPDPLLHMPLVVAEHDL